MCFDATCAKRAFPNLFAVARTKSFAFTGLVILICGGSLLALFPMAWIKIAFAMAMLAFTGLLMKIFQDQ